jgi:hypothetical protein
MLHLLLIVSLLLIACGLLCLYSYARDSALQAVSRDCQRIANRTTRNAVVGAVGR